MRLDSSADPLIVDLDDESDTDLLGRAVAAVAAAGTVIGLVGPLGAGKTRLARAIAEALGVDPLAVSSPTFVLIHEYEGRLPVYHFDAYRLGAPGPFEALGVADYWEADGVCLVEWADLVSEVLPASAWWVRIEPVAATGRRVSIRTPSRAALVNAIQHAPDRL
jgi:tRNA threonylcarbamoyladenosine biosynthesis protein TsaE